MNVYGLKGPVIAVYMDSVVFFEQEEIENRVDEIYGECFNETGIPYFGNNSVLILYVNMKTEENKKRLLSLNKIDALKSLNLSAKNILGFLRVELYVTHAEIYDVCTGIETRRQGIMHTLFSHMFKVIRKDYFWLGVAFDNEKRDEAIKFYLTNSFSFSNVTFRTPSNVKLKFPVLGFVNRKIKERNLFDALSDIACNFTFKMRWVDMAYIQNNVYGKNVESGGVMNVKDALFPQSSGDRSLLIPDVSSIVYGDPTNLTIEPPLHYINWHSHPHICYKKNNCYIGWPSGQDMKYIFYNYYYGLLFHLLFTAEGLYTIQLTEKAMRMVYLLSSNRKWLDSIADLIKYRFTYVEKYRTCEGQQCLFSKDENVKRNSKIQEFLKKANTATLKDYLDKDFSEYSNVVDSLKYLEQFTSPHFPLFQVTLYPSPYIAQRSIETLTLATIRSPTNNFCPF